MPVRSNAGLRAIALFKLAKAALLLSTTIGVLKLIHRDLHSVAEHWLQVLQADPNNSLIHGLIARTGALNAHTLREISAGSFFYGALLMIEGLGLWYKKRWAEYLTVFATTSLVPLEVYELARYASLAKFAVLAVNLAIVWYLVRVLRATNTPLQRRRIP